MQHRDNTHMITQHMMEDQPQPISLRISKSFLDTSRSEMQFSSFNSSEDLRDLEYGGSLSLRDKSKRLSDNIIKSKTELYYLSQEQHQEPKPLEREETSGIRYWLQEFKSAREHGGDYAKRNDTALRAALGSSLIFAVLIFPQQQILGAVWIGNIFMHATIADSLGSSITTVEDFGSSIIMTTAFSWPLAYFLARMSLLLASVLLPFVVFVASFLIMTCPQLTSRNLMILVMYIVVASVVREEIEWWEPLGWTATYLIGMAVAVLMNVLPSPRIALNATHTSLLRLEKDLTMLLLEFKSCADNTAVNQGSSRSAVANIIMLDNRISNTTKTLKAMLPATKVELSCRCQSNAAKDLEEWVVQAEKLRAPLKSLQTALQQRVLGEDHNMFSSALRETKAIIKAEISPARDRMVDAMIASVAICHAWADPSPSRTGLPDVEGELAVSLYECRLAFHRAMFRAAEHLRATPETNTPVFAHLTRRMSAFNALFELGDSLRSYLEKHRRETEETDGAVSHHGSIQGSVRTFLAHWNQSWLWRKPDSYRLALKTSVGMVLASLFVAVPYLWNVAKPFGIWPGLTIASVNLGSTGSSFHKAFDRICGTLLAAAYALLVSDLFPGNSDFVKIPAIAVFTYVLVYLRTQAHSYKFTYAATSIGSMLYGSAKNDFNIPGYIPKRIELIFVGIALFSFVELLLFPRSSRKLVESLAFDFFFNMRGFLKQASVCTLRVEEYVSKTSAPNKSGDKAEYFQLDKLAEFQATLKQGIVKLKAELESGLDEPHVGLSLPLDAVSFRGLVKALADCEFQSFLLLNSLQQLVNKCQNEDHSLRTLNWLRTYNQFLTDAANEAEYTCESLKTAYPDGRLRPQGGNSVKAVSAASSFRGFEDVRLRTISKWADYYSEIEMSGSDPLAVTTLGIAMTYFLELCRQLQKAGRHVEQIAHRFPPAK